MCRSAHRRIALVSRCLLLLASAFSVACTAPDDPPREPPLSPGCNPLGGGEEDCLLPFPSSFFTRRDPQTATGWRVALRSELLPRGSRGTPLDATLFNHADGFSAATTLLAHFTGARIDSDSSRLPGPNVVEQSLDVASPVQLLRFSDGMRVPLWAEIDKNATPEGGERQALVIRPVVRLQAATRYVVVVQDLVDKSGAKVPPLAGFAALRDGYVGDDSPRAAERTKFEEIFALLTRVGIQRSALQLAWDFTTGSDEQIIEPMLRMRDQALAYAPPGPPPSRLLVDNVIERPATYGNVLRLIAGRFLSPSFLVDEGPAGRLNRAADGTPQLRGYGEFPLAISVPACAASASAPLPVTIFGHGSYSTAAAHMQGPVEREMSERMCMILIGTDWIGHADGDRSFLATDVLPDANNFVATTDRLQQSHVNVQVLARLIRQGALNNLRELQHNGKPLVDGKTLYYWGVSEGGFHGATALALTSDIERGCLNVPWGFWSAYLWRSSDFVELLPLLSTSYRDPLERQVMIALTQPLFDPVDPASYGAHLLRDPLPGGSIKPILYQEGINDVSVPNLFTRMMVRTIGLPLLSPPVEPVFAVTEARGPLESAYVQFDVGSRPRLGEDNIPPDHSPVHDAVRALESAKLQLERFLVRGGRAWNTCNEMPCVYPLP